MEGMKVGDDEATALWSMFAMEEIQRSFGVLRVPHDMMAKHNTN